MGVTEHHCRHCGATDSLTSFTVQFTDRSECWTVCADPYACLERELDGDFVHRALQAVGRREVRT